MISANELKYFASLKKKKYRQQEGKFLIEGKRLVEELLKSPFPVEVLMFTEKFKNKTPEFFSNPKLRNLRSEIISSVQLKKLSQTRTPQGIVAVAIIKANSPLQNNPGIIVALDNVSEPGNLGTILRNCSWFGIEQIIIGKGSADIFNPKSLRASMGAIFHLNIKTDVNLKEYLTSLQKGKYRILLADIKGKSVKEFEKKKENIVMVFSNEASGPSKEISEIADLKITIPKIGQAESLNVASASAIILYELTIRNNGRKN